MNRLFTFRKAERLTLKKDIDSLFQEGLSFTVSPFKVLYRLEPADAHNPVKVLITVPRKRFKLAVDRNRLRRLIREAWRLNRHTLDDTLSAFTGSLHVGIIYTGDRKDLHLGDIERPVMDCLGRLARILAAANRDMTGP